MVRSAISAHRCPAVSIAPCHMIPISQYSICFIRLELRTTIHSMAQRREARPILFSTLSGRETSSHLSKDISRVSKESTKQSHHTMQTQRMPRRMCQLMTASTSSRSLRFLIKTTNGTATSARLTYRLPRKLRFTKLHLSLL